MVIWATERDIRCRRVKTGGRPLKGP